MENSFYFHFVWSSLLPKLETLHNQKLPLFYGQRWSFPNEAKVLVHSGTLNLSRCLQHKDSNSLHHRRKVHWVPAYIQFCYHEQIFCASKSLTATSTLPQTSSFSLYLFAYHKSDPVKTILNKTFFPVIFVETFQEATTERIKTCSTSWFTDFGSRTEKCKAC